MLDSVSIGIEAFRWIYQTSYEASDQDCLVVHADC